MFLKNIWMFCWFPDCKQINKKNHKSDELPVSSSYVSLALTIWILFFCWILFSPWFSDDFRHTRFFLLIKRCDINEPGTIRIIWTKAYSSSSLIICFFPNTTFSLSSRISPQCEFFSGERRVSVGKGSNCTLGNPSLLFSTCRLYACVSQVLSGVSLISSYCFTWAWEGLIN